MIKRYVLKLTNLFTETTPYFEFVESCLRHKSEMVIYEAANAIVNLKRTTSRELIPAISVLQLFCSSPKATMRFAAVRTLNQVSFKRNKRSATFIIFLEILSGTALISVSIVLSFSKGLLLFILFFLNYKGGFVILESNV